MAKWWVDTPSGWRFGFPKIWDSEMSPSITKWMHDEGWPEDNLEDLQWLRMWEWKESEDDQS